MIKENQVLVSSVVRPLAVAVLLLASLTSCNERKNEVAEQQPEEERVPVDEKDNSVTEYVDFVNSDDNKMDLDHAYTNEALRKLVDATNAVAAEASYDVKADMEKVEQYAAQITNDPFETTHADNIRNAAGILTTALQNMQREKFPNLSGEAEDVKEACESINPDQLTLDQKDAVKSFFHEAANLLEKMD